MTSFLFLCLGILIHQSNGLLCHNCMSEGGRQGCLPIMTENLAPHPQLCLTLTIEFLKYGHNKLSTILHVGTGKSPTVGFNRSTYGSMEELSGNCVNLPTDLVVKFYPSLLTILSVKACGCTTDFCNKQSQLESPDLECRPLSSSNTESSNSQGIVHCHNCVSTTGLVGCVPFSQSNVTVNSTMCAIVRTTSGIEILGIPLTMENVVFMGVPSSSPMAGMLGSGENQKCLFTLPDRKTYEKISGAPSTVKLFSMITCLCRGHDYCHCDNGGKFLRLEFSILILGLFVGQFKFQ